MTMSRSQCLVTGVYRSGTEYVAQLLSGHPELSSTMYHVNALRFVRGRYEPLSDTRNARRAVEDTAGRLKTRYALQLDVKAVLDRFGQAPSPTCAALYDAIMSVLWLKGGRVHWAEKCQLVWREIPEFIADMSNGRAILVLRDPRSVLASFKRYTYAPPPAYLGAIFNCLDAFNRARTYQATLPPDRFFAVRYEDAARDPLATASRMFQFLGLDPTKASFDRAGWRNEKGESWQDNTAFDGAFRVEDAIERWRGELSDLEIALTEEICGPLMRAFGYELAGKRVDWPAAVALCRKDPQIAEFLRRWQTTGEGVEAFPTDPLRPENWEEASKRAMVSRAV
jgi:hypothetical protein